MSDETRSIPPVEPVLDPKKDYEEINSYVVFWGLFYAAVSYTHLDGRYYISYITWGSIYAVGGVR